MIAIIMGVAGSGKTTIGRLLASSLGLPFYDGDDYHSVENRAKMARGEALTDGDRAGWLDALASLIAEHHRSGAGAIIACSALKASYRERLRSGGPARFIFLHGPYELIHQRLQKRRDHYMQPAMLASQFAALDVPTDALLVDIDAEPEAIVALIVQALTT